MRNSERRNMVGRSERPLRSISRGSETGRQRRGIAKDEQSPPIEIQYPIIGNACRSETLGLLGDVDVQ